ncbi:MAG TPA: TraR/DksA C4-type zinc finger protein [Nitrospira sp.]|nr:TraR/DksA C4-type zinc finger protein [Nitrospira sp.]
MKSPAPAKRRARLKPKKPRTKPSNAGGKYATIRRDLQRQRLAILEEAGEGLPKRDGREAFPDVSDQASAEVDQNFAVRIREREQKLLKKIDEALDRMKKNTYGICERCEEEIPYERLKARPVTTLCISCKTQQEQEEKIRR